MFCEELGPVGFPFPSHLVESSLEQLTHRLMNDSSRLFFGARKSGVNWNVFWTHVDIGMQEPISKSIPVRALQRK